MKGYFFPLPDVLHMANRSATTSTKDVVPPLHSPIPATFPFASTLIVYCAEIELAAVVAVDAAETAVAA